MEQGDAVLVIKTSKRSNDYRNTIQKQGIISNTSKGFYGVLFDGFYNQASSKGVFWYSKSEIKLLEENEMSKLDGFTKVAVIENGSYNKNYYYALFDDDVCAGDHVLVTGAANGNLMVVKDVLDVAANEERLPKSITAEVICRVDFGAYNQRLTVRKEADELRKKAENIRKQLNNKRKEIEARKDDEYYAEIDPEYAKLLNELKELKE